MTIVREIITTAPTHSITDMDIFYIAYTVRPRGLWLDVGSGGRQGKEVVPIPGLQGGRADTVRARGVPTGPISGSAD